MMFFFLIISFSIIDDYQMGNTILTTWITKESIAISLETLMQDRLSSKS